MEWLPIAAGGSVALASLAFAWWSTRDSRGLSKRLIAAQRMATEKATALMREQELRFDETATLQGMLQGRDREIAALRRYADELDDLLASGQCDDLTLARLRKELSASLAAQRGDD